MRHDPETTLPALYIANRGAGAGRNMSRSHRPPGPCTPVSVSPPGADEATLVRLVLASSRL